MSSIFFFLNQKQGSVSMDLKRPSYQHTVWWTMQGLMEPFLNIVGCCNFTEAKVVKCVQFYWTRDYFSKTNRRLQKKTWMRLCTEKLACASKYINLLMTKLAGLCGHYMSMVAGEASAEPDSQVPENKPGTCITLLVYSSLQVLLYEIWTMLVLHPVRPRSEKSKRDLGTSLPRHLLYMSLPRDF